MTETVTSTNGHDQLKGTWNVKQTNYDEQHRGTKDDEVSIEIISLRVNHLNVIQQPEAPSSISTTNLNLYNELLIALLSYRYLHRRRVLSKGDMVKLAFAENERVLCYHGPLIYEAKVLKAEDWKGDEPSQSKKGVHYWVHYKGWKQSWDEWVPEDRLLKLNEENLRKQKELNEARRFKDIPDKPIIKDKLGIGSGLDKGKKPEGRGTKRSRDIGIETEEEPSKRPNIRIVIPEPLKLQLVDDWEAVTRKNQVVTLPRNPTVSMIFQEYETYESKSKPSTKSKNLLREVLAGIKVYFDKSLGHSLLYRYERQQYIEIRKKPELENKLMSDIYGAEHLLRLFVNLPEMISHTPMEPDVVEIVREHISDMLEWMVQEQKRLFQSPYDVSSPAYQNINRAM